MKICFDSTKYHQLQTAEILKRVKQFKGRLYLEFGGKLFDDFHASRVLPGFSADEKIKVLKELSADIEIIMVVSSRDIQKKRVRADYQTTYDQEVLRQISRLRNIGLNVSNIVVTLYSGQKEADKFIEKLKNMGENVYVHGLTDGYPDDVDTIVSPQGYGKNPYIKVTKPIVVVTAPGAGSGKMATCLSQIYHESLMGKSSGYGKFETFPIWNLPVDHPVNLAYEASTADLADKNMVDPFHLRAYGTRAVNYNRDIASFPILQKILEKISGSIYKSPTDMGVNMAGFAITDQEGIKKAGINEVIRRYYNALCDARKTGDYVVANRIYNIIRKNSIDMDSRKVIRFANTKSQDNGDCLSVAIELANDNVICGRETELLTAPASAVLNCLKELSGIDDSIKLLKTDILEPIIKIKQKISGNIEQKLSLYDVIVALSICAKSSKKANLAYEKINELWGCDAHCSHIITNADMLALKSLNINVSCEPKFIY